MPGLLFLRPDVSGSSHVERSSCHGRAFAAVSGHRCRDASRARRPMRRPRRFVRVNGPRAAKAISTGARDAPPAAKAGRARAHAASPASSNPVLAVESTAAGRLGDAVAAGPCARPRARLSAWRASRSRAATARRHRAGIPRVGQFAGRQSGPSALDQRHRRGGQRCGRSGRAEGAVRRRRARSLSGGPVLRREWFWAPPSRARSRWKSISFRSIGARGSQVGCTETICEARLRLGRQHDPSCRITQQAEPAPVQLEGTLGVNRLLFWSMEY